MLAYAANRSLAGERRSSPNALLLIIGAHVALVAVVMSAKMDLPPRILRGPPLIKIPIDPLPRENLVVRQRPAHEKTTDRPIDHAPATTSMLEQPTVGRGKDDLPTAWGGGINVIPEIPKPIVTPIRHDPRLLTPPSELKPPYPPSKILSEEEAVLTLRLSIDEQGRVTAVEPVGKADRDFLESARRHVIAHWRYLPAMDGGHAVASSVVISLRFELDG